MNSPDDRTLCLILEYVQIYSKLCRISMTSGKSDNIANAGENTEKPMFERKLKEIEKSIGLNTDEILAIGCRFIMERT